MHLFSGVRVSTSGIACASMDHAELQDVFAIAASWMVGHETTAGVDLLGC